MEIRVTLEPNQEVDVQTFTLDDLGLTQDEWHDLSIADKESLLYTVAMDNICGIITDIEQC